MRRRHRVKECLAHLKAAHDELVQLRLWPLRGVKRQYLAGQDQGPDVEQVELAAVKEGVSGSAKNETKRTSLNTPTSTL
jgi:hypothetical protein